jgi:hypothetical protein
MNHLPPSLAPKRKTKEPCTTHLNAKKTTQCPTCERYFVYCVDCCKWVNEKTRKEDLRSCCEESLSIVKKVMPDVKMQGKTLKTVHT